MPTGYTADIKNGISFETFALNCARAFGACVTLRDESGGGEKIPDKFEPSDYHSERLEESRTALRDLELMTPEQCEIAAENDYADAESYRTARLNEIAAYRAMLENVRAWNPPTADHAALHSFMREQIEQSIRFDCTNNYLAEPTVRLTGSQWKAERFAKLLKDQARHAEAYAEDVERAAQRTAWVQALRMSLTKNPRGK